MTTRCAVLGRPIGHSLSPVLHRAAYAELGLAWRYEAHEVGQDELPGFLDGLDGQWRGLSLTMPLKRAVVPLLDEATDQVELSGVANTVILQEGRRLGHNTDIDGAVAALRERTDVVPRRVAVLGGGATAASVLLAAARLGCTEATVLAREPARARGTAGVLARQPEPPRVRVLALDADPGPVDLLVSTIPAAAQAPALVGLVDSATVVFDVTYDPWPSPLAVAAADRGRVLVSGLDLLVHQAVGQVRLMTGCATVPVTTMRLAGERALSERGR